MNADQDSKPIFGASVLETLTVGMYTNPLDAIRELIQNSCDALNCAIREGLVPEPKALIEVTLDQAERKVTVRDNGTGILAEAARPLLTNVGTSQKTIGEDIGFRGIGRLHGIAYCDQLIFRTSAAEEAVGTEVIIDAKSLREWIAPNVRGEERAEDILYACTTISRYQESKEAHYFEATLKGVSVQVPQMLEFNAVYSYLSQVVPVNFDTPFYFFSLIREWMKKNKMDMFHVPMKLKSLSKERFVYKPYSSSYRPLRETKDNAKERDRVEITGVAFYPEDGPSSNGFWIWYSKSNLIGQIGDRASAGIRLRKHNMSIGDTARIDELMQEPRFSRYFIGEVHITSPHCLPNARRDGFEDTPEWGKIRDEIGMFLKEREKEVRNASKQRSDKVVMTINKALAHSDKAIEASTSGLTSKNEKEKLLAVLEEQQQAIEAIPCDKISEEIKDKYDTVVTRLARATESVESANYVVAQAKGQLDRKQKKLLQEILETLEACLPEDMFKKARQAIMARFEHKEA